MPSLKRRYLFVRKLKEALEILNITESQLAEAMGLTNCIINVWKRRKQMPHRHNQQYLAHVTAINLVWFMLDEAEMYTKDSIMAFRKLKLRESLDDVYIASVVAAAKEQAPHLKDVWETELSYDGDVDYKSLFRKYIKLNMATDDNCKLCDRPIKDVGMEVTPCCNLFICWDFCLYDEPSHCPFCHAKWNVVPKDPVTKRSYIKVVES
jgi:transcriptional regulator with XRE-family HTH domain